MLRRLCFGCWPCEALPDGLRVPLVPPASSSIPSASADADDADDADLAALPSYEAWVFRSSYWAHQLMLLSLLVLELATNSNFSSSPIWVAYMVLSLLLRYGAHKMADYELAAFICGRVSCGMVVIPTLLSLYDVASDGVSAAEWLEGLLQDTSYMPGLYFVLTTLGFKWYEYAIVVGSFALLDGYMLVMLQPADVPSGPIMAEVMEMPYFNVPCSYLLSIALIVLVERNGRKLHFSQRQHIETVVAQRTQERYVSALSHDFGTPTAGLVMCIDSLERVLCERVMDTSSAADSETAAASSTDVPTVLKLLKTMRSAIDLLVLLKSKAIALSKAINKVSMVPELEPVDLRGIVRKLSDVSLAIGRRAEHQLEFLVAPEVPQLVLTDGGWLLMMLTNLLTNSLKHQSSGLVTVSVQSVGDERLRFVVADNGVGIAPEFEPKLFQPFAQASRWSQGTGLGLFHVHMLATALKGTVSHQRNTPTGAVFTIEIPCPPAVSAAATTDHCHPIPVSTICSCRPIFGMQTSYTRS